MGGANEICTDKTGTLTTGKMTIQKVYVNDTVYSTENVMEHMNEEQKNEILLACVHNVKLEFVHETGTFRGNSTDKAILNALQNVWKLDAENQCKQFENEQKRGENGRVIITIPFNSDRKRMTTAYRMEDGSVRLYVKGTPNVVIPLCNYYYDKHQKLKQLTEDSRAKILNE